MGLSATNIAVSTLHMNAAAAAAAAAAKSLQSCPTLCYPIDGSLLVFSLSSILRACS